MINKIFKFPLQSKNEETNETMSFTLDLHSENEEEAIKTFSYIFPTKKEDIKKVLIIEEKN